MKKTEKIEKQIVKKIVKKTEFFFQEIENPKSVGISCNGVLFMTQNLPNELGIFWIGGSPCCESSQRANCGCCRTLTPYKRHLMFTVNSTAATSRRWQMRRVAAPRGWTFLAYGKGNDVFLYVLLGVWLSNYLLAVSKTQKKPHAIVLDFHPRKGTFRPPNPKRFDPKPLSNGFCTFFITSSTLPFFFCPALSIVSMKSPVPRPSNTSSFHPKDNVFSGLRRVFVSGTKQNSPKQKLLNATFLVRNLWNIPYGRCLANPFGLGGLNVTFPQWESWMIIQDSHCGMTAHVAFFGFEKLPKDALTIIPTIEKMKDNVIFAIIGPITCILLQCGCCLVSAV